MSKQAPNQKLTNMNPEIRKHKKGKKRIHHSFLTVKMVVIIKYQVFNTFANSQVRVKSVWWV